MIIAPISISGGGKSFLRELLLKEFPDMKIVCPDDIRREKFGDVNEQKDGHIIFQIAYSMTERALKNDRLVYFDATNLGKSLNDLIKKFGDVVPIFLQDSDNLELCFSRVSKDIENGKDRSKVPYEVIQKQYEKFEKMKPQDYENSIIYFDENDIDDIVSYIKYKQNDL
jgi:predicted kinase